MAQVRKKRPPGAVGPNCRTEISPGIDLETFSLSDMGLFGGKAAVTGWGGTMCEGER